MLTLTLTLTLSHQVQSGPGLPQDPAEDPVFGNTKLASVLDELIPDMMDVVLAVRDEDYEGEGEGEGRGLPHARALRVANNAGFDVLINGADSPVPGACEAGHSFTRKQSTTRLRHKHSG